MDGETDEDRSDQGGLDAQRGGDPARASPPAGPVLDRLTRLAARALRAPAAQIRLFEGSARHVASSHGLPDADGPLPLTRHVVDSGRTMVVRDLRQGDPSGEEPTSFDPGVVAYLGTPVRTREGRVGGVLAVFDTCPREWSEADIEAIGELAATVTDLIGPRPALPSPGIHQSADLRHRDDSDASERRYRWLADNTAEVIWRVELDLPCPTGLPEDEQIDWYYRHAHLAEGNRAMALLYGVEDPTRLVGLRLEDIFPRADPRNDAFVRAFIRSGYRVEDAERSGADPLGRPRSSLNNMVGMLEGEAVRSVWGTSRDITARKRVEEALETARDAAEAANRAKDNVLAILSHELRTPLTPTLLAASALLEIPLDPEARRHVEAIRRNVTLEARLVDDLLDGARIIHGGLRLDWAAVDLHEEIRQAVEICRCDLDSAGVSPKLELAASAHHIFGDATRIKQIAWNLIRNAAKFTPAGGRLCIRSANPEAAGPAVRIVVDFQDSGIGIEPDVLARIFDPFEQGDAPLRGYRGGLGLGLAIGRGLAEAHGGGLTAVSPGKGLGTTFRLELETIPEPPPHADAPMPRPIPAAPDAGRLRIMIVEDNADTLEFLTLVLRHRGHAVTATSTLAGARAAAISTFDLILSDIELPDGNGHDLIRELNALRPTPAIAFSGFGSEEDVRQSREAGFAEHLTKPIDMLQLEAAIHRVAGGGG